MQNIPIQEFLSKMDIQMKKEDQEDRQMQIQTGAFFLIIMCVVILGIGLFRKKTEWLLNIVMRSILGIILMYFVNFALTAGGIVLGVGINAVTVLTSGILGLPGLAALYAIGIYNLL